jgi:hypothetical protein
VGGATERILSVAPTIEEVVPESAQQMSGADEPRASTQEWRLEPSTTTGTVESVVAHVEEEAPACNTLKFHHQINISNKVF